MPALKMSAFRGQASISTLGGLTGPASSAGDPKAEISTQWLRAHKVRQLEIRLVVGLGKIEPTTLVFGDVEGAPLKPHTVSRAWQRVVAAKGLPRVSFHALRHTHASALFRAGVDVLTISRRLGHSSPSMTLDIYGHLIEGADAAAAKAISEVLK